MSEQWGDWTDGFWADVQAGDQVDKGKIWTVTKVDPGAIEMSVFGGPPVVGSPPMSSPVKYRRPAPEPPNVVVERRPELHETAAVVLDDLAAMRAMPVEDRVVTAIERGHDPSQVVAAVERAEQAEQEAIATLDRHMDAAVEDAAIAAAEGYDCSPVPFSDLDAARLRRVADALERLNEVATESLGALAAGLAPAALGMISAVHVAFADLAKAYAMALTGLHVPGPAAPPASIQRCAECVDDGEDPRPWCDCRPDESCKGPCRNRAHLPIWHDKNAEVEPLAGDMDAERGAVNNLRAASLEPEVIQRVLAYDDLAAHLSEKHGDLIPERGKRTKIEARGELADAHFNKHEKGQLPDQLWEPRGVGAGHTHPVMDRPMIVAPTPF